MDLRVPKFSLKKINFMIYPRFIWDKISAPFKSKKVSRSWNKKSNENLS